MRLRRLLSITGVGLGTVALWKIQGSSLSLRDQGHAQCSSTPKKPQPVAASPPSSELVNYPTCHSSHYEKDIELIFSKDWATDDQFVQKMEKWVRGLQQKIAATVEVFEGEDGKRFLVDQHKNGIAMILQDGKAFTKAGVNISCIKGKLNQDRMKAMLKAADLLDASTDGFAPADASPLPYHVCGISVVLHPKNPFAPTIHFNYRYFEVQGANGMTKWWFGGGTDLTPKYVDEQDAVQFHHTLKTACDSVMPGKYGGWKKDADEYFYIPHRKERRGVGGIFFDYLKGDKQKLFSLIDACGNAFTDAYAPLVARNVDRPYDKKNVEFQQLRHGRYVEFNVMYDRGTKFGLVNPEDINVERVLMSLPLEARFEFMYTPKPGSPEDVTQRVLSEKPARDWVKP